MLRVEGLHTYYGHGHILQGVDLEVPEGRIAAVLGRNGVGKTTTLRSIVGLTPPRSGRVLLAGKDVAGWAPHLIVRIGVGYVPEGRMIFPDLTVVENIRVAQRAPAKRWSMDRLFTLFPALAERRHSKGSQLSGGEQQMLAVARALVTDPRVILFDEPSQGLAPLVVEELTRLIGRLRDEGVSILLVEQNLKLAEAVADLVYVMVKGQMVYHAPLERFRTEREKGEDEVFDAIERPRSALQTQMPAIAKTLEETVKIEIIKSSAPRPLANYNECFKVGPWVFAAGQIASDYQTGVAPEARKKPAFPYYGSDIKLQTHYVLGNLKKTFEAAGSSLDNVVKAQVFLTDLNNFNAFDEIWREYFKVPPPRTTIGTTGLLVPGTLVEIDLIGYVAGQGLERRAVKSGAPQPLANYTEAFTVGNLIFAAGQLASDFKTGVPPEAKKASAFPYYGSDIKKQTRYILENLEGTFAAAGGSLGEVLKAQVFMTDLNDFNGFDEVWKEYFKVPPARTTVGTSGLLVPGTLVEIDLIGLLPGAGWKREVITSSNPKPLANYTEAFRAGGLVFAAGQIASDFATGVAKEARVDPAFPYYGSSIKKQTRYILSNLKSTFESAGSSFDHVVKAQVFLTDLNDFFGFDEVWKEFFKNSPPRTTVGTSGLLVEGCRVEIDLVGVVPS